MMPFASWDAPGASRYEVLGWGVDSFDLIYAHSGLRTFGCDVLCYGWEQGLKEPIQEDPIVKLDFT